MTPDDLVRRLIRASVFRAVQESVAALIVAIAFSSILQKSAVGSLQYYGCLLLLIATGAIVGVVWSFALSRDRLRVHPATDLDYWREEFQSQARLLRRVPYWYLAPLGAGLLLFTAPTSTSDVPAFLIATVLFAAVFAAIAWLNLRAAAQVEQQAAQLGSSN